MPTDPKKYVPRFIDHAVARARPTHYAEITVDVAKVIESWRASLFSYEWLLPDGRIKDSGELPPAEAKRRMDVEDALSSGREIEKPVLGIGILESVEIGAGRATFLTLAARGVTAIPVHIPASQIKEFKPLLKQDKN